MIPQVIRVDLRQPRFSSLPKDMLQRTPDLGRCLPGFPRPQKVVTLSQLPEQATNPVWARPGEEGREPVSPKIVLIQLVEGLSGLLLQPEEACRRLLLSEKCLLETRPSSHGSPTNPASRHTVKIVLLPRRSPLTPHRIKSCRFSSWNFLPVFCFTRRTALMRLPRCSQ